MPTEKTAMVISHSVLLLIGGGILAMAAAMNSYFVLRRLKGSVALEFANRAYSPGEVITGRVELLCRKPVECHRFFVALVCEEVITTQDSTTRRVEIIRQEQDLAGGGQFPAGTQESYPFSLPVPAGGGMVRHIATGNQTVDNVMNGLAVLATRGRFEWHVEARVDARGIDLARRRDVSINTM